MSGFFILIGLGLFALAVVVAIRPLPQLKLGKRILALPVLLASLGSCVVGASLVPPLTPEQLAQMEAAENEAAAAREREAARQREERRPSISSVRGVTQVEPGEDTAIVRVHIEDAWDDRGYIDQAANILADVAQAIQADAREIQPSTRWLHYRVTVSGLDRLGNEIELGLFNASYDLSDLKQANLDNLGLYGVLGLSTEVNVTSQAARRAVIDWCADDRRGDAGRGFCIEAL